MLKRKEWELAIWILGFKNLKEFQKWAGLKADGIYGKLTDRDLQGCIKKAKKSMKKLKGVTAKMKSGGKVDSGMKTAVKQMEKHFGEKKVEGRINTEQRKKLDIQKGYKSKRVGTLAMKKWQSRRGDIKWKEVPYFKEKEFYSSKDKGKPKADVDPYLLNMLIRIRKKYGRVTISSGVRSQKYNDSLKGSKKNSKHIKGKAADIIVPGTSLSKVMAYAKKQKRYSYTYTNNSNMKGAAHVDVK